MNNCNLLTITSASELLIVKESWLRSQIFYKLIPYYKLGNHIRFDKDEILKWISTKRVGKNL
ncbi:MAG: helix-turn-helix domain-containing protein [Bacteriovoracaceae bacterium]|nr:helix-turn-helix domain-containing protein [Bacteriovoracaceae bacterium]